MPLSPSEMWLFLPVGYLLTVAIEIPILLAGLSKRHRLRERVLAGLWLTAVTYPIVVLVLPYVIWEPFGRMVYVAVAETFAPAAECLLFRLAYVSRHPPAPRATARDCAAIVAANLASFLAGVWIV